MQNHTNSNNFCQCKTLQFTTADFDDGFGYWDVCCKCGKKLENGYHGYKHYDGMGPQPRYIVLVKNNNYI